MFPIRVLKFLDDLEPHRESESKLAGKKFKPAIEPPYRWRDWAAQSDSITGDELLAFIHDEETTLPNGKKGAVLFRYPGAFVRGVRSAESLARPGWLHGWASA